MSAEFDAGTWGVGIAGSIIAGMTGSFLIQKVINHFSTNGIRDNVKKVIKDELEVNLDNLNSEDISERRGDVDGIGTTDSTHVILETWSFESAVKSGNYILLNKELRKEISDVYALMEIANRQSDQITKLTFVIKTTELEVENYKNIIKVQKDNFGEKHKKLIPKIESLIKQLG